MLSMKEQSSVSVIHSSARPWQQRMATELQAIHSFSYHAYAQAPTGVGKTYMMALYGEDFVQGDGVRLIIVGRKDLVSQHQRALKELYKEGKLQDLSRWMVITWQAATRIAKNGEYHPLFSKACNPDILFFDECHLGGSSSKAKSIPIIKFGLKPSLWLNVSATTWDVNEGILGKREGFLSSLSYEEAYKEGYLNPVVLNRVDVGMEMTLKAKKIEEMTGIPFYKLAEKTPEEVASELKRIGRKEGVSITARDVEDVVYFRIRTLIELYAEYHIGEKAIFWTPNTHYVEYARTYFDKVMVRKKGKGVWSHAFYSKNDYADNAKVRDDFVNNDTKRVMFVCHMLTEGFDFPELSLLFDASFNPSNIRRMLQKIGRALRIIYGWNVGYGWKKPVSQFYYAVDVRHMLSHSGRQLLIRDDFQTPGSLQGLSDSDIRFGTEAIADRMALIQSVDGEGKEEDFSVTDAPVTVESVGVEDVDGEEKQVRVARIPFFEVEDVSGKENRGRMAFRDVFRFNYDSSDKKARLLEYAKEGVQRGELPKDLNIALSGYTSSKSKSYDIDFNSEIRLLAKHWFRSDTVKAKKDRLLEYAKDGVQRGELPKDLNSALKSYTNSKANSYDSKFNSEVRLLAKHWFRSDTVEGKKARLLEYAKEGVQRGELPKDLNNALSGYTCSNSTSYNIDFNSEIRLLAKHWFPSDMVKDKKARLLEYAKEGVQRSELPKDLNSALVRYACSKAKSYDIEFNSEIRLLAKHWFPSNRVKGKKARLLEYAKEGVQRGELPKDLNSALSSYINSKSKSYDIEFDSEIRLLAKHWFIADRVKDKKARILEYAKEGVQRGELPKDLNSALSSYTSSKHSSYDTEFDSEIRLLAKHWFRSDRVKDKKDRLFEYAKEGVQRGELPKDLNSALKSYTNSKANSYDSKFNSEVRLLAKHWFRAK